MKFGTDGVRGEVGIEITASDAQRLGRAASNILPEKAWHIGWDTRESSEMLVYAFASGLMANGCSVAFLGHIPSGAVSLASATRRQPGVMVTASHNPYTDNGIKIFSIDGRKLDDEFESLIEDEFQNLSERNPGTLPARSGRRDEAESQAIRELYESFLTSRASNLDLRHLHIAIDCAHGAAYKIAPAALGATGAKITTLGDKPDGVNINKNYGSTSLGNLQRTVMSNGCDFGLAFDGDADRFLAVNSSGEIVDGDQLLSMLAIGLARQGQLQNNGVVASMWSNLGLRQGLKREAITFAESGVGDKAVAETMRARGFALGGEQSGHIILSRLLPVGDGPSTAIELLGVLASNQLDFNVFSQSCMTKFPQESNAVGVARPPKVVVAELQQLLRIENDRLAGSGRLVLRASGTEPVVRVMVEASTSAEASEILRRVSREVDERGQTNG